ncbi:MULTISPECIES: hypothetical protein [unclassified Anaerobiospirillum]|uniref:hypothetical protein n=1 Tax=unclassified Anaerobiospirillum TaxID=2647410 RepID=UPI001FF53DB0|nr:MULTISPECIES: hypothetical protein [unclassified Anaerobiospirillum]MCK0534629.1 hypothetical protein [Anaerobiospirillum sp. NML120511]MCK0540329.1 hypothetical protein [Anaerobiospirillum sp. NML02-A-032]
MNWLLILAIAVPFLFVIGVINNAVKDQRKLEKGKLQGFLEKRAGMTPEPYDDEDEDWGQTRHDLKKAVEQTSPEAQQGAAERAIKEAKEEVLRSEAEKQAAVAAAAAAAVAAREAAAAGRDAPVAAGTATGTSGGRSVADELNGNNPALKATQVHHEPLGNTEASDASSYFSRYYKQ